MAELLEVLVTVFLIMFNTKLVLIISLILLACHVNPNICAGASDTVQETIQKLSPGLYPPFLGDIHTSVRFSLMVNVGGVTRRTN